MWQTVASQRLSIVLSILSISLLCASQIFHALDYSIWQGATSSSRISFYGVWNEDTGDDDDGENNEIVDDDDNSIPKDGSLQKQKKKRMKQRRRESKFRMSRIEGKRHWRMLKRKHDYIDTETLQVHADISDFLDFAIIGNPKTGTTFLVEWLNRHPDLWLPEREMRHLLRRKGPGLVVDQFMYMYRRKMGRRQLGYKCPADVREITALTHLRDSFPKTKLVVGLRHPVWWFQSFYNYRIREERDIPGPHACRGPCGSEHIATCTYNAYFHLFLAQMGQTALTEPERALLRHYDVNNHNEPLPYNLTVMDPPLMRSVFLYDQNQIDGRKEPEIAEIFRRDMTSYLDVSPMLPSLKQATQKTYENKTETAEEEEHRNLIEAKLIDICQPEFNDLREELVKVGTDAADWILNYFAPLPNVFVSSPDFFRKTLEEYKEDPCLKKKAAL